jgi:hypothetical protein
MRRGLTRATELTTQQLECRCFPHLPHELQHKTSCALSSGQVDFCGFLSRVCVRQFECKWLPQFPHETHTSTPVFPSVRSSWLSPSYFFSGATFGGLFTVRGRGVSFGSSATGVPASTFSTGLGEFT